MELKTEVKEEYLSKACSFAVQYHLNQEKMKRDRTTGKHRSLGAIIDAFISGKVIELGVIDILKKLNDKKEYIPDLVVRSNQDFSDPDVVVIKEQNKERKPQVFVEIKNDENEFRWTGLYKEQFETMQKHPMINNDLEKIYIIYASLKSQKLDEKEKNDLLGIYLKRFISREKLFDEFSEPNELHVQINYIITGKELADKGEYFNHGDDNIFETDVFVETELPMVNDDGSLRKNVALVELNNGELPVNEISSYPTQFGNFTLKEPNDFVFGIAFGSIIDSFSSYYTHQYQKKPAQDEVNEFVTIINNRMAEIRNAIFNCG